MVNRSDRMNRRRATRKDVIKSVPFLAALGLGLSMFGVSKVQAKVA
jgi:hypothetical protein